MRVKPKTLKRSEGFRNWCGPAALSILTGRTTKYCAKLCADYANKSRYWAANHTFTPKNIKGTYPDELKYALDVMGFTYWKDCNRNHHGQTLIKMVNTMGGELWKTQLLVELTRHWVVLYQGKVYDNARPAGVDVREASGRCSRVKDYWLVARTK